MPTSSPLIRVFVEFGGSVAEVCLLVQRGGNPALTWQWDVPYGLWAQWGTNQAASWLGEQFRRHDAHTFAAVGGSQLRRELHRGLQQHQQYHRIGWLDSCPP